ncbi:MAG: serine/threonine-protein kinase [Nocardioides sp.]
MIAGRYELEREVGRGGMGAVWLARDEVLGRQVAVKRVGMVPGGATPDLERAEREARLAARLNHPHVVAVFDLVTDDDGQWLVMEYVEGVTLAGLVQRDGALDTHQVSPLLRQAADALAAAHAAGIVHRDVKPSNILVTPDGQVKLSDFGIARAEADASLTQTGLVTGSPAYLAPEIASGQPATDASDVWSLGATLYHALSGHPPYQVGDNLMGALYRIVHEEPPRLPDAGWLAPLLAATMTRDPADRWSMAQVRDYLVAGPSGTTIHPTPSTTATTTADLPAPDSTQVLAAAPVPADDTPTDLTAPPAPVTERPAGGRRTSTILIAVGVVTLVVLLFVAWALITGDDEQPGTTATPDRGNNTSSQSEPTEPTEPTGATGATPAEEPNADDMTAFIEDYLATAPSSPETSFERLTPAFQEQSGGFGGYAGYWGTIESATLGEITADPEALTVAYTVDYVRTDGAEVSDEVVLGLVFRNGEYLIASEGG